jgi:hypothetical protein
MTTLQHVITSSRFTQETSQCLQLLEETLQKTGHAPVSINTPAVKDVTAPPQTDGAAKPVNSAQKRNGRIFFLLLWALLLLMPAAVTNVEKHTWLARYTNRADRRGPFIAFVYSPMCRILLTISAILVLLLRLPAQLGCTTGFFFLFMHLLISWLLCLIPIHAIESLVKKNTTGLLSYFREQLALLIIKHQALIAGIISIAIMHNMVLRLPLWPVLRPLGTAVAPVAFFAFILLLLQLLLPWLLLLRRWPESGEKSSYPQPVYIAGNGYRQGIIESGALSFNAASVIFGGMHNHLAQKFMRKALFNDFLLLLIFASGLAALPALNPIFASRLFGSGPYFVEALAFISALAFCGILRRSLQRQQQKEIDSEYAANDRADHLLQSLEIINKLNFFPDNMREGERSEFDPLSLEESRNNLRAASGLYLPALSHPDGLVLVSLWRGRLALDWKLGREEAVFLTSLDYQVNSSDCETELCALAARHNRLGADCIYLARQQQLKIVFCCQKFSAFTAETPLPQDKICSICSEAMQKACQYGPYKWESTPEGCLLTLDKNTKNLE